MNNTINDFINQLKNTINEIPAEFRYPILVSMGGLIKEELPKAKEEYSKKMLELEIEFWNLLKDAVLADKEGK